MQETLHDASSMSLVNPSSPLWGTGGVLERFCSLNFGCGVAALCFLWLIPSLIPAASTGPGRIQMVRHGGPDHLHAPDLSVFNEKCFRNQDAGRPVESPKCVRLAGGE